ncbi:MAG TPA: two-component regulator propeller domain-containing protein [Verrucomicrobiae bacterium]|nr:two-component regulator propeller domain-containing protein [Verrucomicrobiae bacterium]
MKGPSKLYRRSFLTGAQLLLLASALAVHALDPSKSLYQYNCRTWTRQNGFPASGVNSIAQTKDGYLWLGTGQGLVSFDGVEFRLLDMSGMHSPIVTSLAAGKGGGLWFSLERGAFGYCDGKKVSYRGKKEWGGETLNVHAILEEPNGDLWLGSETEPARLIDQHIYTPILLAPGMPGDVDVTTLYRDSKERVWVGTAHRGLYFWDKGTITRFPDPIVDGMEIRCLAEDRLGRLWIGTDWGPLCYDSKFQRQPFPFPWHPTHALLVDREGTLWMGTTGGGLVRYEDGTMHYLKHQDGLPDDVITALAEDREGNLWVGTRGGLSQLSDLKIPTFGKTEGLPADVNTAVCASRRGGLWIASEDGITYFDGKSGTEHVPLGLTNNYVNRVFESRDGTVYVINGYKDIQVLSSNKWVARYPNQSWPSVVSEDAQGIIVAMDNDLFRIGTNGLEPCRFTGGEKPGVGWIFNLWAAADGSVLVAGSQGISRVKPDGTIKRWTSQNGLLEAKVTWVCEDKKGVVWAGTDAGLVMIQDGKVRNITQDKGLFDNIIYAVVPDEQGNLWVDSGRGFYMVNRQSLDDFARGKVAKVECVSFDGVDGVKSAERFQQQFSGCITADGRIWFPTAAGVAMIDPAHISKNSIAPQVYIQTVRANGRELNAPGKAIVKPGQRDLEFNYTGLSYIAPLGVRYRYKLEGYDPDWMPAGNRRSAFYTNLKPGKYCFQVQACNQDGVWNLAGAQYDLTLLPHFYETTWFIVLAISAGGVMVFALYVRRLKQLKQKQVQLQQARDLLEAKVNERTAELQNEVEERKRVQREVERIHRELVDSSRQAGQAEVASSVLHNVGNVLNSVNVSACIIKDRMRSSKASDVNRIAELLDSHREDLSAFLASNGRSNQVIDYLKGLARRISAEHTELSTEIDGLSKNIDHIKEIVAMQQSYARVSGVVDIQSIPSLVADALRMHQTALENARVTVLREFEPVPDILVDKHKVLQILVNLISNAKNALAESNSGERVLRLRVSAKAEGRMRVSVSDNGVGIAPQNLSLIFTHGFTTRRDGHGFGLHSGFLTAKEIGGTLEVLSEGLGKGATFTLEIPFKPVESKA